MIDDQADHSERDRVLIRDLTVSGVIGIHPHERLTPQPVVINVEMFTDVSRAAASDRIEAAINYQAVSEMIVEQVKRNRKLLVESLAVELARLILTGFDVARVRVRVDKPAAIDGAAAVGVEVDRSRADFS